MSRKLVIAALRTGLCILLTAIGIVPVGAAETYWQHDPASPGDWFDPANWTNAVPDAPDYAYIKNGGQAEIAANSAEATWLFLGEESGDSGTVHLSGTGQLSAELEHIGYAGTGTFTQTGGTNAVSQYVYLGEFWGDGTYQLSGTGQLRAPEEFVGALWGTGTFTQTGGTNTVSAHLYVGYGFGCEGTYELSGTGQLSALEQYIGHYGTGTFTQTGGTNTTGYLSVKSGSRYHLSGGTLTVTDGTDVSGTLDFANGTASVTMGGIVNLGDASLMGAGSTSFTLNPDSLLIVPAGFDPATEFGTFTNNGWMVHQRGSTLIVPAGERFTFTFSGKIEDPVVCEGTINVASGNEINFKGGLSVSGNGSVDFGVGSLRVEDILSGISGGQLSAGAEYIGFAGTGRFTQTGGTNTVNFYLYLGYNSGSEGTYELSGTGQLAAMEVHIGESGTGTFTQTGRTSTVTNWLYVGRNPGSEGTYELRGTGQLSASTEYIGTGTFAQTGGSNTTGYLYVNSAGRYELSGGTLTITDGAEVSGTFDFAEGTASAIMAGLLNLGNVSVTGAGSTSFTLNPDSLLIVPAGFDPAGAFGSFTNHGSMVHQAGSTLIVAPGEGFAGSGTIDDPVVCQGTIKATSDRGIKFDGGLNISGNGIVDFGSSRLTLDDSLFAITADGQLCTGTQYIGHSGTATLTQTGGRNTVSRLYLAPGRGSQGTYELSGTGQLSAGWESVGYRGTGTFTQTGGTNTVSDWLKVGRRSYCEGTYELSGTGELSARSEYIGSAGTGTFTQTRGTNTVTDCLHVGYISGSHGTYNLSGTGQLSASTQYIGHSGRGTFTQTGGTNTVSDWLIVGRRSGSHGTYNLSGTGQLSAHSEYIGSAGTGTFAQTGGTHTVSEDLYLGYNYGSDGTYELSGTGQLSAGSESVGYQGTGTFTQTGGSNTTGYLSVNNASRYELSGGRLTVSDSAEVSGTLDFAQDSGALTIGGLVNLGNASFRGAGAASFTLSADSLLIVPAGFDPATEFGTFTNHGSIVHEGGSTLIVPAGRGFTGTGTIEDHVACQGTINATSARAIDLTSGLNVSGSGTVALGSGTLTVEDTLSGISDTGQVSAKYEYIGDPGTGTFTQSGGTNTVSDHLYIGDYSRSDGTYELSAGELSASVEYIGRSGRGTFTQTGGTHTVSDDLYIAGNWGSRGTYVISAGQLAAGSFYVGRTAGGTLDITGSEAEISVSTKLTFSGNSSFTAVPGSTIHMTGAAFENTSRYPDSLSGLADLRLVFEGGSEEIHPFEVAGKDRGPVTAGFERNFALGTLQLGGTELGMIQLVNNFDNRPYWEGSEALYVWNLDVGPGSYLDLGGLNLYYLHGTIDPDATIVGGTPTLVPEPSTVTLSVVGILLLILFARRWGWPTFWD